MSLKKWFFLAKSVFKQSRCRKYSTEVTLKTRPYKLFKLEDGPASSGTLTKERAVNVYNDMFAVRMMETVARNLYREKKIRGFCHLYIGQESVALGMMEALRPQDNMVAGYRVHAFAYLFTKNIKSILYELFGTQGGIARGKGGSMHMYSKNLFGGNGIVGAQVPLGAGAGLAHKYKGDGGVSFALYGDGAANQGQIFEAYNIAKLWNLPVVFVCENNKYAMGTSMKRGTAAHDFYTRANYIPGIWVDGNDVVTVREATKFALDYCSSGKGPMVMEFSTYRFYGHSMSDPDTSYRTRDEVKHERQEHDPVKNFKSLILKESLTTEDELQNIEKKVKDEIDAVVAAASSDPELPVADLTNDIYFNCIHDSIRGVTPWAPWKHTSRPKNELT